MSSTIVLVNTQEPKTVEGLVGGAETKEIWFKSKPVDRKFCYRVAQLQLSTDSHDQGFVDNSLLGSYSWFEVSILEDEKATEPRFKDTRELTWRSHSNRLGVKDVSRHYGVVFDRRGQLLDDLEPGNVIAVRICVQFQGWENVGVSATIHAKLLNEGLKSHYLRYHAN
jgi:hypothetical protein